SHQVLETALRQQQQWRKQGMDYTVAVNLSARNLIDDRFITGLQALMLQYATEPGSLELEITETALMQDPEGAARLLDRIADLGVKLSIDDFGTGYSSLSYLRRLPISSLKIDRLFVRDMLTNEQDAIIVRSIIGLAHNLGHKVVAEGVENAATQAMLRGMACDVMQGFHLCRPMPWEDIEAWLQARRKAGD
ncbi:MAG TPA: EAL domain-containing protein, partial [Rhodocyclaceae bacterium]|nr:EAL domain-containing protein [Rhodocyclaceae bacterium]